MFEIVEADCHVEAVGLVELNGVDNKDVVPACEEPMQVTECVSASEEETLSQITLCNEMLDCVAKSVTAHFKSQQVNEPELDVIQKRQIAKDILNHSPAQFLSRFGQHVELKHLQYFSSLKQKDYEIAFYLQELSRFHCKSTKQVDVKNRRFEALKKMLKDGSYFSESEMKNRNPLLYEQLIGQYLTQREIEEREHAAMVVNSTLVSVLLAQIERDQTNNLRQKQKDEEGGIEEVDTSDEESEEEEEMATDNEADMSERDENSDSDTERKQEEMTALRKKVPTHAEKEMFKEEFYSFMYNSFLEGNDVDIDYSLIDYNSEFECLTIMNQDAEEKYFDAESPEEVDAGISGEAFKEEESCVEDELDAYMNNLKAEPTPTDLAGQIENL